MPDNAQGGKTGISQGLQVCAICSTVSKFKEFPDHCPVCDNAIRVRKKNSLQRTWALIITAMIFIIPANVYPITFLMKNNTLYPDTIFSGILSLVDSDMLVIAFIVFFASILVPFLKIITLTFIALSVQFKWNLSTKSRLYAYKAVDWIGKWSVLDLFVISIMVSVFDKGTLLLVYPGIAASAFTLVVIITLFAASSFDTRLIWDAQSNDS
ncbi:MAG: paraquat-inducible protein A [Psychromonas sp.]|nr:paraquat-inducible protein A [Psychromonas sp.]